MVDYAVVAIREEYGRIVKLRVRRVDGTLLDDPFDLDASDAIRRITGLRQRFRTAHLKNGKYEWGADVQAIPRNGSWVLQSVPNGYLPDNLESLPRF